LIAETGTKWRLLLQSGTGRFEGFDKLPFGKLRACNTAGKLKVPSLAKGDGIAILLRQGYG